MKSNPFATLAYGAMTLLVAVYIAFVALLMHHDAMPIPVFAGIAFAALAALLLGAKACRTVKLDVAERQTSQTAARSSSPPDAARWSTPST